MPPIKNSFKEFRDSAVKVDIDKDKREITLSFSSEEPFERAWGIEILDHDKNSVDLERLNSAAPLLFNHNKDLVIGVVKSAKIENKKGVAVVRFGNSKKAIEVFNDVADGILKNVSVGYEIFEMVLEEKKDNLDVYRVTKWKPFEISIVSIPADYTVGIGRSKEENKLIKELIKMPPVEGKKKEEKQIDINKIREEERTRVKEIHAIGNQFKMQELSQKAIEEGLSVDEFRAKVLEKLKTHKPISTNSANIGMNEKEIREYSFAKALRAAITGNWDEAGLEREVSKAIEKKLGKDSRGFFVPHEVLQRDILTTTEGSPLIQTHNAGISFVELLRNQLVVSKLGGTVLSGLSGKVAIPKQIGSTTAYWIDENEDTTESNIKLGLIELSAKTVSSKSGYSRQMLLQANPDIESLVMRDLSATIALAVDKAAIAGKGGKEPTGIINTTGVGAVDCSNGINWEKVVEFESKLTTENMSVENVAYTANAKVAGILKTTLKAQNTATYLLENNQVNGYKFYLSNQVPENSMVFGDFSHVFIGMWGGLDIMVDPYAKADSGGVVIRAFQDIDVALRYPQAFSVSTNIKG